jgi:hypothetical protein
MRIDETKKCHLTYSDEPEGGGYLVCTFNHKDSGIEINTTSPIE